MRKKVLGFLICGLLWTGMCAAEGDQFVYDAHERRDPFWSLITSSGTIVNYDTDFSATELTLEGTIIGQGKDLAIIDGNIVEKGGQLGQYQVVDIKVDSVVLQKGQQMVELFIKKEE